MFGNKKAAREAQAAAYEKEAAVWEREARKEAAQLAKYRKSLKSGSSDPAADRYMIQHHDAEHRTCTHNAKVYSDWAKEERKRRWF